MPRRVPIKAVFRSFLLLATLSANVALSQESIQPAWNAQAAAEYLDGRAEWWLNWNDAARGQGTACVSCHTSGPFALSRPVLDAKTGVSASGAIEARFIENLKKRVENWEAIVSDSSSGDDPFHPFYAHKKPASLGTEAVLNALVLVNYDVRRSNGILSIPTKKALGHLWHQQDENGAWQWLDFGMNPWENDGAYFGANLAAIAVGMAGRDYFGRDEIQPKLATLVKYLNTQSANQPIHHLLFRIWASSLLPGILSDNDKAQLLVELFNLQESDGGWSLTKLGKTVAGTGQWKSQGVWPAGMLSDGYATGLVVLALKRAGVARDDLKLQKGIRWLMDNQQEGTWPANYVNKSRDPQSNAGKFMRDAATAFAVLALGER